MTWLPIVLAVLCAAGSVWFSIGARRELRRMENAMRRAEAARKQIADPDRIAVLEHDLLGIHPEPGTPAARAVALAKPIDQTACPHDDVIKTTGMGQARPTGLCGHCGAGMVADDAGEWQRP